MPRVGRAAYALGFAGLLPALATTGVTASMRAAGDPGLGELFAPVVGIAVVYPLAILSFLGGMWWGFAMRRPVAQGRLVGLAVLPSLAAVVLIGWIGMTGNIGTGLIAIGVAVILTLFVDNHLALTGEAPAGWMRLRVPLSLGLGTLTIASGVLASPF